MSADGYFNVDNGGYGQKGCIIFKPDIESSEYRNIYVNGDKFRVTVTGLKQPLSYQVSFFNLYPEDISRYTKVNLRDEFIYTGKPIKPEFEVLHNEKLLVEGKDYIVECEDNIEAGDGILIIKGINNYSGELEEYFTISPADATKFSVSEIKDKTYTGKKIEQNPVVKNTEGQILEKGKDYKLYYDNNIETGEAKVTVSFRDNYKGEIELKFKILPVPKEEKVKAKNNKAQKLIRM